jgi:Luciferase-like monooxygenase
VQEFIPARAGRITRVEVLGGKFLYGINVYFTGESSDLCPGDICKNTAGEDLQRTICAVDAPRKGERAPSLDAWSTAAALAAVTRRLELMVAVRPTFHLPALLAKQAANIDHISGGRISLNVVSSWWCRHGGRRKPASTAYTSTSTVTFSEQVIRPGASRHEPTSPAVRSLAS